MGPVGSTLDVIVRPGIFFVFHSAQSLQSAQFMAAVLLKLGRGPLFLDIENMQIHIHTYIYIDMYIHIYLSTCVIVNRHI